MRVQPIVASDPITLGGNEINIQSYNNYNIINRLPVNVDKSSPVPGNTKAMFEKILMTTPSALK